MNVTTEDGKLKHKSDLHGTISHRLQNTAGITQLQCVPNLLHKQQQQKQKKHHHNNKIAEHYLL